VACALSAAPAVLLPRPSSFAAVLAENARNLPRRPLKRALKPQTQCSSQPQAHLKAREARARP